ncbi:MAG: alpha/beta hydrolase, partial [Rhodospirillaceae bacterium]|nr:alpha/beta hydrolase [Rhodospirillaceae bacterium]
FGEPVDGLRLPLRRWLPEGRPAAAIVALHGFNDYSNAFAGPAARLRAEGIAVYAYDQRGFGAAPGRGLWPGRDALTRDLRTVAALVRATHPGLPLFVMGESMGGAVVLAALAREPALRPDGAILIAPAVWGRKTMDGVKRSALWIAAHTTPWMELTGRGLGIVPSDNIEMLRALARDPMVIKRTRIDAIWGLVDLMDEALAATRRIETPTLVLYGMRDQIIPRGPTLAMLERMPEADAARRRVAVYEDGFHMLTRDLEADVVLDDILAWIESRLAGDGAAPLPSGADRKALARLRGAE